MSGNESNGLLDKLAEIPGQSKEKIQKILRDKAIKKAIEHLSEIDKTPFEIGEEKFEILVDAKEKEIVEELKNKALKGLGIVALLLGLN